MGSYADKSIFSNCARRYYLTTIKINQAYKIPSRVSFGKNSYARCFKVMF